MLLIRAIKMVATAHTPPSKRCAASLWDVHHHGLPAFECLERIVCPVTTEPEAVFLRCIGRNDGLRDEAVRHSSEALAPLLSHSWGPWGALLDERDCVRAWCSHRTDSPVGETGRSGAGQDRYRAGIPFLVLELGFSGRFRAGVFVNDEPSVPCGDGGSVYVTGYRTSRPSMAHTLSPPPDFELTE